MALAARAGDTTTGAMAGAVCAQVERVTGRPTCRDTLARALALPEPPLTGWLHLTPRYLATRFALFDDRLDDARAELLRMLPATERGGAEELAEVLRGLAEVAARGGRCREALDFAARAMRIAEEAALSPGPCWYTAAVAELAGGSVARGLAYAERGVRASEQEHDTIYLGRNLHVVGQARLAAGDAEGAVAALRRLATAEEGQGSADPSVLRWHSDLAAALVAVGAYTQAAATVAAARDSAARLGRSPGVLARLDRSAALVLAEVGDAGGAVDLAAGAAQRFAELGQPVERGHALLVLGQAERRRRRYAAGRGAVAAALAVFEEVGAVPWAERARRGLAALQGGPPEAPTTGPETAAREGALTSTEARIAELVRQGASNREIASRLYVSVKTVEATLTRIYRKLGVRSRTQLTSRLGDS
jgi:DNA-binding CsgD family transcriptional regulator